MEWLPARKLKPSLDVEPLEDRRLLSFFAPVLSSVVVVRPIDRFAETAPMPGGSTITTLESFDPDRGQFGGFDVFSSEQPLSHGPWNPSGGEWMSMPDRSPFDGDSETGFPTGSPSNVSGESTADPIPASIQNDSPSLSNPESLHEPSVASPTAGVMPTGSISLPIAVPRVTPAFSIIRSTSDEVQTSRYETSSTAQTPGRSGSDEPLLAVTSTGSGSSDSTSLPDQARGSVAILAQGGPGGLVGQSDPEPSLAPSKGLAKLAEAPEVRGGPQTEGASLDVRSRFEPGAEARSTEPLEVAMPEPSQAGLIQNFLPFDRAAMDAALDQFLEPFDDLASAMPEIRGPMGLVTASLAAAATVVAFEIAIRLRRDRQQRLGGDDVENLARFSGL